MYCANWNNYYPLATEYQAFQKIGRHERRCLEVLGAYIRITSS